MAETLPPVIPEDIVLIDNNGVIAFVSNALEAFFRELCIETVQVASSLAN